MKKIKEIYPKYIYKIINSKTGTIKFDSREISPGDIFIALKGKKTHGNKFIEDAINKKAKYIISEKKISKFAKKIIYVKNCLKTIEKIARCKRSIYKGKIIAITGSVGKTSTKEQLNFFLNHELNTYCSIKSYNNSLGVSLSLANLDLESSVSVFEIGTNNFGEIKNLSKLVKPNIAIITNIEATHLKNFKNIKNIAKEKSDIFNIKYNSEVQNIIIPSYCSQSEYILAKAKKNKYCKIYTFGNHLNDDIHIKNISKKQNNKFLVKVGVLKHDLKFNISIKGYHQVFSSLICLCVFKILKLKTNNFVKFAPYLPELSGRGKTYDLTFNNKTVKLIDESYNASPVSMKATIQYFQNYSLALSKKKFLILGDMLELGSKEKFFHSEIVKYLKPKMFYKIITCGNLTKNLYNLIKRNPNTFHAENESEIYYYIKTYVNNGDLILAKCSNTTMVNNFVSNLKNNINVK